jgi:hypothetical protein
MAAADRVLELLDAVLGRRSVDPAILADLVREKVTEGQYHEYKAGKWLTEPDVKQELRAQVSGFANAEGGVLIIGIVGGEPGQGAAGWTFDPPACPDQAGWDEWLGRVLADVSAKTRVEWNVVTVGGVDVVVVAATRAEALIRVYEKRNLVCHLRVGPQTIPIPETLFADLALGRRAKPDLTLEQLSARPMNDSSGFHLGLTVFVHNQGLLWVPDLSAVWVGYTQARPSVVSASIRREIDLRPTTRGDVAPLVARFGSTLIGGSQRQIVDGIEIDLKPFDLRQFTIRIGGIPLSPPGKTWAWYAAIMVLPRNGSPLWAQVAVQGNNTGIATVSKAWALPPRTVPVVAWLEGDDVPASSEAFFGLAPPANGG